MALNFAAMLATRGKRVLLADVHWQPTDARPHARRLRPPRPDRPARNGQTTRTCWCRTRGSRSSSSFPGERLALLRLDQRVRGGVGCWRGAHRSWSCNRGEGDGGGRGGWRRRSRGAWFDDRSGNPDHGRRRVDRRRRRRARAFDLQLAGEIYGGRGECRGGQGERDDGCAHVALYMPRCVVRLAEPLFDDAGHHAGCRARTERKSARHFVHLQ